MQKTSPTLSQALHLINGEATSGKIGQGKLIDRLVAAGQQPMDVVKLLYERCLGRSPRPEEVTAIQTRLSQTDDVMTALADLYWALLNSNEFVFNH